MFDRFPLILAPTPLHRLDRVSQDLGADVWIKRDDLTGFALGGNKGRKLEYLIADALGQDAEVVVACGAAQSNFLRQLAAACNCAGLGCAVVTMALPFEEEPPAYAAIAPVGGNALLTRRLGADFRLVPNDTWECLYAQAEDVAREYELAGKRVYRIPVGGSAPLGAYAFFRAAQEIASEQFDTVIFASSSGSTHTGLLMGLRETGTRVLGIACDPEPEIAKDFAKLGAGLAALLDLPAPIADDYHLDFRFVGPGYGVPSEASEMAIDYLARREGIFLDPIYSGKAFAALRELAPQLGNRILFWHTGGTPALFASS